MTQDDSETNVPQDPMRSALSSMRPQLPKRFYKEATIGMGEGGHAILLDGRPVRTPGRIPLELPTVAAAQLVADEFSRQADVIDPMTMPVTRLANTAIDGVAADPQAIVEDVLRYAGSDLICYRADTPARLVDNQAELWDPVLDWIRSRFGVRFVLSEGITHVAQPRETIAVLGAHLAQRAEPFRISAIHLITSLTGSALIAVALEEGALSADEAWAAAHVDEDWNISQWGEDAEAIARRALRRRDFDAAVALLGALG